MMGFKINDAGVVLHVVKSDPTEGAEEESSTVFPEDFDEILAKMQAPAEVRENPVFAKDGSYKMVKDESPEVLAQIARQKKIMELGIG